MVDNNVGNQVATLLSGRLAGGLSSVYKSFCIGLLIKHMNTIVINFGFIYFSSYYWFVYLY